jgi:hypothetical protein
MIYKTRRKKQWVLSPSPDFPMHTANTIINRLVDRVLKLEPDAKVEYKFFRGEPRIAKASIENDYFKVIIRYDPPYGLVHGKVDAIPAAEITAELVFNPEKQYDAKKQETLAEIVRKL